ncbi:hypothetical protein [Saccharopolyspora griseoalba]|uniref:Uncharacterized protein n=1 Tax=Saccharopolyspora griseoalba TaxID=1431848 RepID=A0ABW2LUG0_9PSEU
MTVPKAMWEAMTRSEREHYGEQLAATAAGNSGVGYGWEVKSTTDTAVEILLTAE